MASPHVAGVAALVQQAHPDWSVDDIGAAIQKHADPSGVAGYKLSRGGTRLVDTAGSVATQVVALGDRIKFRNGQGDRVRFQTSTLSFGYAELSRDYRGTKEITVRNHGTAPVTLLLGSEPSPQSVEAKRRVQCGFVQRARRRRAEGEGHPASRCGRRAGIP